MDKVFLDTNVILDLFLDRRNKDAVARVAQKAKAGMLRCYCSYLSVADIAYILHKTHTQDEIKGGIKDLMSWCEVLAPMSDDVNECLRMNHPDFEDALQIITAENKSCDIILTGNTRHFEGYTDILVISPEQL